MPEPWTPLRASSQRINVYNEALLVYLYDESHVKLLQESEADFESGYGETDADTDAALKKLAKAGVLIAYELLQDDEIDVEVLVGPPLTKLELKHRPLMKPIAANLRLPSGTLRIDSANTFPHEDNDASEPAGRYTVDPGDYVVSLYRWDSTQWPAESPWDGPGEVLVLTRVEDAKPVKGSKAFLRYMRPTVPWVGRYSIVGNTFAGKAFAKESLSMCLINIDVAAEAQLKLVPGTSLRIEIESLVIHAVFAGHTEIPGKLSMKIERGSRTEIGIVYRLTHFIDDDRDNKLVIERTVATLPFPKLNQWIPATLTVLELP